MLIFNAQNLAEIISHGGFGKIDQR